MYNNIVEANELFFKDKICDAISAYQTIIDNLINNSSLQEATSYPIEEFGNIEIQKGYFQHHISSWYKEQISVNKMKVNPFTGLSLCYSYPIRIYEGRIWYQQKLSKHGDLYQFAYSLGNCYYNANLINEAYQMYLKCIQIDNHCDKAYQGIALIRFYKYEQNQQARQYALKALTYNKDNIDCKIIVACTHQESKDNISCLQTLKQEYPEYSSKIQHLMGVTLFQEGNIEESVQYFVSSLNKYEYISPMICLANIAIAHNSLLLAQQMAHWVLKLEPSNFNGLSLLGYVSILQEKYVEAGEWLYAATEARQNHYLPIFYLGIMNYEQGDYEEAIQWFQRALQINIQCKQIYLWISASFQAAGQLSMATKNMLQYATDNYDRIDIQFELGRLYFMRQRYQQALRMFEKITAQENNDHLSYFMLGCCQMNLGQVTQAKSSMRKSVFLHHLFVDGLMALAYLQLGENDDGQGIRYVKRVLEIDPDNIEALSIIEAKRP